MQGWWCWAPLAGGSQAGGRPRQAFAGAFGALCSTATNVHGRKGDVWFCCQLSRRDEDDSWRFYGWVFSSAALLIEFCFVVRAAGLKGEGKYRSQQQSATMLLLMPTIRAQPPYIHCSPDPALPRASRRVPRRAQQAVEQALLNSSFNLLPIYFLSWIPGGLRLFVLPAKAS